MYPYPSTHVTAHRHQLTETRKLIRLHQWVKNLFVFGPLIFSGKLLHVSSILHVVIAVASFCLISSAVYILNDLVDANKDKLHPTKKMRPIASGTISRSFAASTGLALAVVSGLLAWEVGTNVLVVIFTYAVANIAYSFVLKHVAIADVFTIAVGFVLRVVVGAISVPTPPSAWLLLCTLFIALFLGFCKRKAELAELEASAKDHRPILGDYNLTMLEQWVVLMAGLVIMAYSLYAMNSPFGNRMMITIPLVVYSILRYMYAANKNTAASEPFHILIGDRPFLVGVILWGIVAVLIAYLHVPRGLPI